MARDRLTSVPNAITAGDTVSLTLSYADFSAATASLSLTLAGAVVQSWAGTTNGTGWDVTLPATDTDALVDGLYQWRVRLTESGVVTTVDFGTITVNPDLASVEAGSLTPWEVGMLPLVEAAIQGNLEGEARRTMIAGRQLETYSFAELLSLRERLRAEIAKLGNNGQLAPVIVGRAKARTGVWTPGVWN